MKKEIEEEKKQHESQHSIMEVHQVKELFKTTTRNYSRFI